MKMFMELLSSLFSSLVHLTKKFESVVENNCLIRHIHVPFYCVPCKDEICFTKKYIDKIINELYKN